MSTQGIAVIRHIDEAERQIVSRRHRAFRKSDTARTAKQHRRANKRVKRAFDVSYTGSLS